MTATIRTRKIFWITLVESNIICNKRNWHTWIFFVWHTCIGRTVDKATTLRGTCCYRDSVICSRGKSTDHVRRLIQWNVHSACITRHLVKVGVVWCGPRHQQSRRVDGTYADTWRGFRNDNICMQNCKWMADVRKKLSQNNAPYYWTLYCYELYACVQKTGSV